MIPAKEASWFLYLLRCRDGSLYTGVTTDVPRRLRQHGDGKASAYTRSRRPVRLLYQEPHPDRSSALKREAQVKRWPPAAKQKLAQRSRVKGARHLLPATWF